MDENVNQNLQARQQVTAMAFASKYKSKREVYNFLAINVKAYLPHYDTITIYFLKDVVSGAKKSKFTKSFIILILFHIVVKTDRFQHLSVPQYDGLNIDKMLEFANDYREVFKFLPDPIEIKKCPKQWLINVIFTVIKQPFANWVTDLIETRNHKIAVDKNLLIDMDP